MNKIEQKIMDLKDFEEAKITVNEVSIIQELNKLWRRAHELEDDNDNTYGELKRPNMAMEMNRKNVFICDGYLSDEHYKKQKVLLVGKESNDDDGTPESSSGFWLKDTYNTEFDEIINMQLNASNEEESK